LHPRRRRGAARHLPEAGQAADGDSVRRGGPRGAARLARPLCRVQPDLRPRHIVRPQDRRQCRCDPDEPSPAGDVGMSGGMSEGLIPVPPGHVGAVVTFLEMTAPPAPTPAPESALGMAQWDVFDAARYRDLFRRVGARWLWFSRLAMADEELRARAGAVHEVTGPDGESAGMIELDFKEAGLCRIRFLGLVPDY